MNELMRKLDEVYGLLSLIPVSGDGVDHMAAARAGLREAYKMADGMEETHGGAAETN